MHMYTKKYDKFITNTRLFQNACMKEQKTIILCIELYLNHHISIIHNNSKTIDFLIDPMY